MKNLEIADAAALQPRTGSEAATPVVVPEIGGTASIEVRAGGQPRPARANLAVNSGYGAGSTATRSRFADISSQAVGRARREHCQNSPSKYHNAWPVAGALDAVARTQTRRSCP